MGVATGLVVLGVALTALGWLLANRAWKRSDPIGFELGIAPAPGPRSGVPGWVSSIVLLGGHGATRAVRPARALATLVLSSSGEQ